MSPTFSHVIACPKCGRSRADGAEACARCGLVFARWSPDAGEQPAASPTSLDAEGQGLWDELQSHWEDAARHDAFVKHCASAGCLPAAGRQYRQRLDSRPDDATAARMQARIVGMATATLAPIRAASALPVSRSRWFWWVVMACATAGTVAGLFFHRLGR